jgi:hypothetical protein
MKKTSLPSNESDSQTNLSLINIVQVTLHVFVVSLATAYNLDCPLLCKGPIDVTIGILRGVEGLADYPIKRDILFQPVQQIGLQSSPSKRTEETIEREIGVHWLR